MIRIILFSVAFIAATGALLWGVGAIPDGAKPAVDQVSRTSPDPMGLQPSLTPALATAPVQAEPSPAPAEPAPQPVIAAVDPAPVAPVEPKASDPMMDVVHSMSMGIVRELQKPASDTPATPIQTVRAAPPAAVVPAAPALVVPAVRTYQVQAGDSLPGIAFRFYGTTVAYLQILQANPDKLTDPSDLEVGMVLRVPELQ